jgi:RNA polymerase sigma-70 factor (ECF subfamily)
MIIEENAEIGLLRQWRSGDRVAGDKLLRRYAPVLQAFFQRKVARNVDELVQCTLLACVQGIERFEGRSSFKSYLLGIAHNQFLMSLRARGYASEDEVPLSTRPEDTPSQLVSVKEEQRILISALIQVPTDFLNVLKMFYWNGLSVEEIARELNIPLGTVKSRLARGRGMLKERLARMNIPKEIHDDVLRRFAEDSTEEVVAQKNL